MSQEISDALETLIHDNTALRAALHAADDIDGATQMLYHAACAAGMKLTSVHVHAFLSQAADKAAQLSEKELDQVAAGAGLGLMDPSAASWMIKAAAKIYAPHPGMPSPPLVGTLPGSPPSSERAVGGVEGISG